MSALWYRHARFVFLVASICLGWFFLLANPVQAAGIINYSNTLSDSGPTQLSNHTLEFEVTVPVSAGGQIEFTPPTDFTILGTSTFSERNVELRVNGGIRTAAAAAAPGVDQVNITPGSPGLIRYTLAPDFSLNAGDQLELRIGNHTSVSIPVITSFSTSTGTTTSPGDTEPIINATSSGRHDITLEIYDGSLVADAAPVIFLVDKVRVPSADTTETVPPFRFNGSPTSTVGGTTLNVEISLETDEFADCRFSTASGTAFTAMTNTFTNTGLVFHSTVVPIVPNSLAEFFVRCIDDEGNFNIDDFVIQFTVNDIPTGTANTDGDTEGDGSGSGDDGTGDGDGSGGTTGQSDGEEPLEGGDSGQGGSGGGGGGGSGSRSGSSGGGGFENEERPFQSGDGRVTISGYGYPNADVFVLVDGEIADRTRTDSSGEYETTIDEIARGAYTFGIYSEDENEVKSSTFSTSFTITGARESRLSNINIHPSISVEPNPADIGQTVTISGYTLTDSEVTIENGRLNGSVTTLTTTSDGDGFYTLEIDTNGFTRDTYQVRARAVQSSTRSTNFSDFTFYGVGQDADVPINADLNRDGSVNLTDFSILLFWWQSNGGDSDPPADINQDGTVNLTDFSILLFNWTG